MVSNVLKLDRWCVLGIRMAKMALATAPRQRRSMACILLPKIPLLLRRCNLVTVPMSYAKKTSTGLIQIYLAIGNEPLWLVVLNDVSQWSRLPARTKILLL